jgi:spore coat polysaccharide biosynthesis protein SpsF
VSTRTVAIIQARMGSTRLPGKVLKPLAGKPMLERVVERMRRAPGVDEVVVATSDLAEEEPILALCRSNGTPVTRGSANDVLSRYALAAREHRADIVVRITSDCPLISPQVVGRVLEAFRAGACEYASNCHRRTFPRGLDTEIFPATALAATDSEAVDPAEREHVTPFIWRRPERFRLRDVVDAVDRSALRWTVDTPDDFVLVERLYSALAAQPAFDYDDILGVLARHPEWSEINRHVEQKKLAP